MKRVFATGLVALFLLAAFFPLGQAVAARGVPGSPDFGYGSWLHLNGPDFDRALQFPADLGLDWVAVELDWASLMPEMASIPDLSRLDRLVNTCLQAECRIMISLTNPPEWAMASDGPDAELTAQFVLWLSRRYSSTSLAFELFPGANTSAGWGMQPDPKAYAALFREVNDRMTSSGLGPLLVAAGLRPGSEDSSDYNDLDYLRALYAAGAREWLAVLSVQYSDPNEDSLQPPGNGNQKALRRYELIRQVMIENNHQNGLLWITLLNSPGGTIKNVPTSTRERQLQAEWLQKSLTQVRSQLYVGAAFIHNLNPPGNTRTPFQLDSLALPGTAFHPFYSAYKSCILQTKPLLENERPGRPKNNSLIKIQPKT